ncbi:MAG: enoyl-CoA hydratase [Rhodospirillaceae bacterium]|jgi:2-(1,2-epoxy-1,2-dihydrophenyl)acetyl-CoA isomerase|nr:enoyl-CoA hydratase [Rhodospirillaceae bacterium]|tara:strand:- start:7716 stop:8528 length:813 start_codon:yes stop_codon:yes gene_type:complete
MTFTDCTFEVENGIAVFTIDNPKERNALTPAMFSDDFPALIERARNDAGIRALVLTGAGGTFCSGGNVKAMVEGLDKPLPERNANLHRARGWIPDLIDLPLPVVAAVDGFAFGAGLGLALCADFVLASARAKFCSVFGRIGLVPDLGILYTLPRAVGLSMAKELVYSARVVEAEEARDIGLVHAIHPADDLLDQAKALAGRFENASPDAIRNAKHLLNQSLHQDIRTMGSLEVGAQGELRETPYHKAAVKRFMAKEPALFDWDAKRKDAG